MKLFTFLNFIICCLNAQDSDIFKLVGFVTLNGCITGGDINTVSSETELQTLLTAKKSSTKPLKINQIQQ